MSETIYLLGAGINQGLTNTKGLKPPLDGDFFQLLAAQGEARQGEKIPKGPKLPHYRLRIGGTVPPLHQASDAGNIYWVYDFIYRFWHKRPDILARETFSLEEVLTFLQLCQKDAQASKNDSKGRECLFCEMVLEDRLMTYLDEFSDVAIKDQDMAQFGRIIYNERSTVITTNYDLIMEAVIEQASIAESKVSDNQSMPIWTARNAYQCKFKESEKVNRLSSAVHPLVLKLHGSLNWGSFVDVGSNNPKVEKSIVLLAKHPAYLALDLSSGVKQPKFLYKPLIVPMVLYKDVYCPPVSQA